MHNVSFELFFNGYKYTIKTNSSSTSYVMYSNI